tara:strand:+ start:1673 stop:1876 length:204 start_codon:yes stop_codon:yes gene_type:complete
MSDLKNTIKMIMKYISNKKTPPDEKIFNSIKTTIKKDLFFKNHINVSLEKSHSNEKLNESYINYRLN